MNLTIPIRAQSSTSSWSRQLRGSSSRKSLKADRKRYVFSMITAVLLVGALIVGSIGGMMHMASAKDNFSSRNYNYYSSGNNKNRGYNDSNSTNNQAKPSATSRTAPSSNHAATPTSTKQTAPAQPAKTTPAPEVTASAPQTPTPTEITPQIVAESPAPKPASTA